MTTRYVALLRGINVGGHHKVPMPELKTEMKNLGFENIQTLLNSGNVLFENSGTDSSHLEESISKHLETVFGFPIPVILRESDLILQLVQNNPFKDIAMTKDIRLYVSFLKKESSVKLTLPWSTEYGAYRILDVRDRTICSVLNLAVSQSPKAMDSLEQQFGKDITTRNWNTILKIAEKWT